MATLVHGLGLPSFHVHVGVLATRLSTILGWVVLNCSCFGAVPLHINEVLWSMYVSVGPPSQLSALTTRLFAILVSQSEGKSAQSFPPP